MESVVKGASPVMERHLLMLGRPPGSVSSTDRKRPASIPSLPDLRLQPEPCDVAEPAHTPNRLIEVGVPVARTVALAADRRPLKAA